MEELWIQIAPRLIEIGTVIVLGLVAWGLAVLKSKVKIDAGKAALDQVDQVVRTVVGDLNQTVVADIKAASEDGHLTAEEKAKIKAQAIFNAKRLLSVNVTGAANKVVGDLGDYIAKKIEEQVSAAKAKE